MCCTMQKHSLVRAPASLLRAYKVHSCVLRSMSETDIALSHTLRLALSAASIVGGALSLIFYAPKSTAKGIHLYAICGVMMGTIHFANALLNPPSHVHYCDGNAARLSYSRVCVAIGLINVRCVDTMYTYLQLTSGHLQMQIMTTMGGAVVAFQWLCIYGWLCACAYERKQPHSDSSSSWLCSSCCPAL
jgi:hypothetical protein